MVTAMLMVLPSRASVGFLLEEPFGTFGALNPTGHGALYFDHICAATPTRLRPCEPGELGVVISRYHKVDGYDWLAIPLLPYLYGVESLDEVPAYVDAGQVQRIRDAYRRKYLSRVAPDTEAGQAPSGEWIQLVGGSFDRRMYSFELETTPEQDLQVLAMLNDSRNRGNFNLFFHNCADFSRKVLNRIYPGAVHRNLIADFALTTPKQVARSLQRYAGKRPGLVYNEYIIPQVPGTLERSRRVDGISESLVRSKKYIVPLVALAPWTSGGIVVAYLSRGRFTPNPCSSLLPEIDKAERARLVLDSDSILLPSVSAVQPNLVCEGSDPRIQPREMEETQPASRGSMVAEVPQASGTLGN